MKKNKKAAVPSKKGLDLLKGDFSSLADSEDKAGMKFSQVDPLAIKFAVFTGLLLVLLMGMSAAEFFRH